MEKIKNESNCSIRVLYHTGENSRELNKRSRTRLIGAVLTALLIGLATSCSAGLTLTTDESSFLSSTNAVVKVDFPYASGGYTYVENGVSIRQIDGYLYGVGDYSPLLPGKEISLSGAESFDIALPAEETNFGVRLLDRFEDDGTCLKEDSSFTFTFKNGGSGGTVVGSVVVDPPLGVPSFVGITSTEPFDFIEVRENEGACENDFFGDIYMGGDPVMPAGEFPVTFPAVLIGLGLCVLLSFSISRRE